MKVSPTEQKVKFRRRLKKDRADRIKRADKDAEEQLDKLRRMCGEGDKKCQNSTELKN